MKKIGIWIDKREAKIVSIEDKNEQLDTIVSEIEEFHVSGGSRSKSKTGPQDVVQDRKYLEREKHQLADFFKDIITSIDSPDALIIFGPAQTGEKLYNEMEKHPRLYKKIKAVEKADNMTDKQVMAWVRNYFNDK